MAPGFNRKAASPTQLAARRARCRVRPAIGAVLLVSLAACAPRAPGPQLLIPVNALCTTCNDFIRCEPIAGADASAADASPTLYHLKPKGFLAQIATILDFLLQAVRDREEDRRPLAAYDLRAQRSWPGAGAEAVTDLLTHRISLPDGWIDQVNGEWHGLDDRIRGRCQLLPIAAGRELVRVIGEEVPP